MNKPLFGLILGGILGVFDGLTALLSAPETRTQLTSIVVGSTFKGLVAGLLIGFFARKVKSLPLCIIFGLAIGGLFAYFVTLGTHYFWKIILPGSVVGIIVGYATQRHQETRSLPGTAS